MDTSRVVDLDAGDEAQLRHRLVELGVDHAGQALPDLGGRGVHAGHSAAWAAAGILSGETPPALPLLLARRAFCASTSMP